MADTLNSSSTLEEMKKILWAKVNELKEERERVWKEHKEFIEKYPPRFGCDEGSQDCYVIAKRIESIIEVGKLLGLVDENVDYRKYI